MKIIIKPKQKYVDRLKTLDLWDEYKKEFIASKKWKNFSASYLVNISNLDWYETINTYIYWSDTERGYGFWQELATKYND